MGCRCKKSGKKRASAELNKPITIISLGSGASDGMGGTLSGETVEHSCMAAIWPLSRTFTGDESVENKRNELKTVYQIKLWYKSGLTADMEIKFGVRRFEIIGIMNKEEANETLSFMCFERI